MKSGWLIRLDFYELIKRLRLETVASMKKTVIVKTNSKVVQFSAQSDIFDKISPMQQKKKVSLKDVFCYPLGPVPLGPVALATSNGELVKTSKSKLMHELEKGVITTVSFPIRFFSYSMEWP